MTTDLQIPEPTVSVVAADATLAVSADKAVRKTIRLVVTDVDGTLLDPAHKLTRRTERALKAVIAQGIDVVLATGKTRNAAPYIWERLGVTTYGIFLQGMATYDPSGQIIHQKTLDPHIVRQVLTIGEDRGFSMIVYSGQRILVRALNEEIRQGTLKYHEPLPEAVGALQNIIDSVPIHKVLAIGDPRAIMALRWQLNLLLGGSAKLMQAGVPEMLEILPPGGGKASALRALLKTLDLRADEVMALGDAENDLEMIQMAGIGVAMGNAEQRIKDAADYIAPSNSEDGLAEALERFVLPLPEPLPTVPESGASAVIVDAQPAPNADPPIPVAEADIPSPDASPDPSSEAAPERSSEAASTSSASTDGQTVTDPGQESTS